MYKNNERDMREIGSEFLKRYKPAYQTNRKNEANLLSGRTALRYIIDDINETRTIRKILLPSYCCESMIEPFVSAGVEVLFYRVHKDGVDYLYENDADAILLIDFFGYVNSQNVDIARSEKQAGKIVIYDATHKIGGNPTVETYSDYSFCSYRKWFYCNYAKAIKYNGDFHEIELKSNARYLALREEAVEEKEKYFTDMTLGKDKFLFLFSEAERAIDEDYVGYSGIPVAFDFCRIASRRRENAAYLIDKLKTIPEIRLWRDTLSDNDVPMFVPVLVDPDTRNDLRNSLIKEHIYCPVHWPKSTYHNMNDNLYDIELSLVCDQRYSVKDMERIINVIKKYFDR